MARAKHKKLLLFYLNSSETHNQIETSNQLSFVWKSLQKHSSHDSPLGTSSGSGNFRCGCRNFRCSCGSQRCGGGGRGGCGSFRRCCSGGGGSGRRIFALLPLGQFCATISKVLHVPWIHSLCTLTTHCTESMVLVVGGHQQDENGQDEHAHCNQLDRGEHGLLVWFAWRT